MSTEGQQEESGDIVAASHDATDPFAELQSAFQENTASSPQDEFTPDAMQQIREIQESHLREAPERRRLQAAITAAWSSCGAAWGVMFFCGLEVAVVVSVGAICAAARAHSLNQNSRQFSADEKRIWSQRIGRLLICTIVSGLLQIALLVLGYLGVFLKLSGR